jgi:hypothetical protein
MALWIQNITDDGRDDDQIHDYRLMLNDRELCRFQHVREDGGVECLLLAAEALAAVEGATTPSTLNRGLMAARRNRLFAKQQDN